MVKDIKEYSYYLIVSTLSMLVGSIGVYKILNDRLLMDKDNVYEEEMNTDDLQNFEKIINLNIKIEPEYYKKFYNILFIESNLESDPYNRKLKKSTVKIFCKIAKLNGIKLDDKVDIKTFNLLYKKLIDYQYYYAKKNNLV
jgi:hypothetical protein